VFHVYLLKAFIRCPSQTYLPLSQTTTEIGPFVRPFQVLKSRIIMRSSQPVLQVLIQWESLDLATTTWEDVDEIQDSFPEFNLKAKVVVSRGSIVTCKEKESQINVELDVGNKLVIPQGHMSTDP